MADPYRAFAPPPSHDRDPQGVYPGYPPSGSALPPTHMPRVAVADPRAASDRLINDVPLRLGTYGLDDPAGVGYPASAGVSGLAAGARAPGFSAVEDPAMVRRGSSVGASAGIPDVERANPLLKPNGPSGDESNILFVDGLPTDCTRREVAHLFRPFIGFKDIRVVHKEPRHSGDKGYVLCFVEFTDAKCALTAMEALQDYHFDERKPDAPVLKIRFVRFPFRPPCALDDTTRPSVH